MKSAVIGFPRVGKLRELKFASEKFFRNEISKEELLNTAKDLRKEHWTMQKLAGIDFISSNDFSFYDGMLDMAVMLNAVPKAYKELNLDELNTYFAMARGYQGDNGNVKAFAMKKWFNTNYHYMVPEIYDDTKIEFVGLKAADEYIEAKEAGIETKPVIIGPFTFFKLANFCGIKKAEDYVEDLTAAYVKILEKFNELGAEWVQFDEPYLVRDISDRDITLFKEFYINILKAKGNVKVLLQTYFGDIRNCYKEVISLDFEGIGLDFLEGKMTFKLLEKYGFPDDKILFAGVVNGKNIWKCDYKKTIELLGKINKKASNVVISTSCSLLHVPYTLDNETKLEDDVKKHFSFAKEKLVELSELKELAEDKDYTASAKFKANRKLFEEERLYLDSEVQESVRELTEKDFHRDVARNEREKIQKKEFNLPILPTTTIGSFPQTGEVRKNRSSYKKGENDLSES